ncbi:hypothetical protein HNR48_003007 [Pseudoteredinibacter isoporae]|uniref:Uncharacterized protein n=1 Tax=Pseudoteredinibacter isoporae TaxID=570281 RepID=A0A7X0MZ35_9GAMM|nr:hypothetical protein [Pseudoteredinibacter isoporae]
MAGPMLSIHGFPDPEYQEGLIDRSNAQAINRRIGLCPLCVGVLSSAAKVVSPVFSYLRVDCLPMRAGTGLVLRSDFETGH